ncbi:hypothetical protein ABTN17_20360, partial [Acinetobacter baumannii]
WRPQSPDAGDDLVIEAAVNGVADVIATYNLRDLRAPAARFLCAMGQEIAEYSGRRRGCPRRATCPGPVSTSPRLDHRRAEGADAALVPRR